MRLRMDLRKTVLLLNMSLVYANFNKVKNKLPTFACFVDFTKAFDSVCRVRLLEKLSKT